ncbi:hypothetical protein Tco_1399892 [Tanacetum coccineum]
MFKLLKVPDLTLAKVAKSDKKKQPAKMPKAKGLDVLSKVALTKAEQLKLATKISKTQFYSSHTKGLGDGVDTPLKVPNEQQQKVTGTNKGVGVRPEVPDVPKYESESEEESWTFSQDDEDDAEEPDMNDDREETKSDNDGDDLTHPNLSTYKADDQEEEEEKADDEEESSNQRVYTPPDYQLTDDVENKGGDGKVKECEEEKEENDDLYRNLNLNLERSDAEIIDAQANKDTEDAYVTLTTVPLIVQQQSSFVSSDLVSKFINPSPDTGIDSILNQNIQSALESEMSEFKKTNQFAEVVSLILGIVDNYLPSKMKDAVDVAVQLQTNKLREEAQAENQEFLNQIEKYVIESLGAKVLVRSTNQPQTSYAIAASLLEFELKKILIDKIGTNKSIDRSDIQKDLYKALVKSYNSDKDIISSYGDVVTLKRGRDDQDKDEDPSAGSNRGSKRRRSGKEAKSSKELTHKESKSTSSSKGASKSQPKSSGKSTHAEEHGHKVDDLEDQPHQEFNTRNDDDERNQSLFNELLASPIDFSSFIMHWLNIKNLTQEVLTGPTYDLIKGACKSVVELEYHLEEVFKATNDQLEWHNPEGKPYPHDLSKTLHLILNEQGRQVIPLDYFINNDLEYLKSGSSSQKYTTSITKMKADDYSQVKWIEDKVSRIWRLVKVSMAGMLTWEHITGVQNIRNSTDMLLTGNHQKMSTPDT